MSQLPTLPQSLSLQLAINHVIQEPTVNFFNRYRPRWGSCCPSIAGWTDVNNYNHVMTLLKPLTSIISIMTWIFNSSPCLCIIVMRNYRKIHIFIYTLPKPLGFIPILLLTYHRTTALKHLYFFLIYCLLSTVFLYN